MHSKGKQTGSGTAAALLFIAGVVVITSLILVLLYRIFSTVKEEPPTPKVKTPKTYATTTPSHKAPSLTSLEKRRLDTPLHPVKKMQEPPSVKFSPSSQKENSTDCMYPELSIPSDLVVYGTESYSGRKTNFQIDQSGHTATQFDITVNHPYKPVALMLSSYEPSIWNIKWAAGTNIVAIWASGYHKQVIAGAPSHVPKFTRHSGKTPCFKGSMYPKEHQLQTLSRRLFNKPIDQFVQGDNTGTVLLGSHTTPSTRLQTNINKPPKSFRDKTAPLAGKAGLKEAREKGLIRYATAHDKQLWEQAVSSKNNRRNSNPLSRISHSYGYVVLKEFTYPAGLYGANMSLFYIPKGVPTPSGNSGHSVVYNFNTLVCSGGPCGIAIKTTSGSASKPAKPIANNAQPDSSNKPLNLNLQKELNAALSKGIIRRATKYDILAWNGHWESGVNRSNNKRLLDTNSVTMKNYAYVVLKPFSFPTSTDHTTKPTFFIPEGVPLPNGKKTNVDIYNFNLSSQDHGQR